MKGWRFYLEYPNKKEKRKGRAEQTALGNHEGNIVAIMLREDGCFDYQITATGTTFSAVSALFFCANSAVCFSSVGEEYLRSRCKRVSEQIARQIHPALFEYLDRCNE